MSFIKKLTTHSHFNENTLFTNLTAFTMANNIGVAITPKLLSFDVTAVFKFEKNINKEALTSLLGASPGLAVRVLSMVDEVEIRGIVEGLMDNESVDNEVTLPEKIRLQRIASLLDKNPQLFMSHYVAFTLTLKKTWQQVLSNALDDIDFCCFVNDLITVSKNFSLSSVLDLENFAQQRKEQFCWVVDRANIDVTMQHPLIEQACEWKGVARDLGNALLLKTRTGNMAVLDLFSSDTNYNFLANFKPDQDGERFLLNVYVNHLAQQGQLVLVNDNYTYTSLLNVVKGNEFAVDADSDCVNCLWELPQKHHGWVDVYRYILLLAQTKGYITNAQAHTLELVVLDVYKRKPKQLSVVDIYDALCLLAIGGGRHYKALSLSIEDFAVGEFQSLFNGQPTVNLSEKVTIFNLKSLDNQPVIRSAALASLTMMTKHSFQQTGAMHHKIYCIDCQPSRFYAHEVPLYENFARQMRPLNASLGIVTSELSEFSRCEVLEVITLNSAWVFSGKVSEDTEMLVESLPNFQRCDRFSQLAPTVDVNHGKYTEIFIANGNRAGVFKLESELMSDNILLYKHKKHEYVEEQLAYNKAVDALFEVPQRYA